MATITEINQRLLEKAKEIAERSFTNVATYEDDKWQADLVLRLQSKVHFSNLLGSGKLGVILDAVTGGGSQAIQWILDTYFEMRLACFDDEAEWAYWCQYLTSVCTDVVISPGHSCLPPEVIQTMVANKDLAGTLKHNPWVLVFYVFPQLKIELVTKKRK